MGEAIKELRSSLTTMLSVAILWLVTVQAVGDALARRQHAKELIAWLSVRDSLVGGADQLSQHASTPVTCFIRIVPVQSGTEVEECSPIVANIPTMEHASSTLSLTPLPEVAGAYRVSATASPLNLSSYFAASINGRIWVFPSELPLITTRDFYDAALRDGLASPRHWQAMRAELLSAGWGGGTAEGLKINDPDISKFVAQALTATFTVASIPISAPMYPAAIATFISLICLLMIGPILKIRIGTKVPDDEPWILVAHSPGRIATVLKVIKIAIALIYISLPLVVFATQLRLRLLLESSELALWIAANILLLICPVIIIFAAISLRRLEAHHSASTSTCSPVENTTAPTTS